MTAEVDYLNGGGGGTPTITAFYSSKAVPSAPNTITASDYLIVGIEAGNSEIVVKGGSAVTLTGGSGAYESVVTISLSADGTTVTFTKSSAYQTLTYFGVVIS